MVLVNVAHGTREFGRRNLDTFSVNNVMGTKGDSEYMFQPAYFVLCTYSQFDFFQSCTRVCGFL